MNNLLEYASNSQQEWIRIIIDDQQFRLRKELLAEESQNLQIRTTVGSSNTTIRGSRCKYSTLLLPEWVTKDLYLLLEEYLNSKSVQFLTHSIKNNNITIKLLRLTDYLGLNKFHELFITQIIIPNLNHKNCLLLLQQTQRKLKNLENGAQCWFNLLNSSINYVATNLEQLYEQQSGKFSKMNDKILHEILDRAIRLQKKTNYGSRDGLFRLIMLSKNISCVDSLLSNLRGLITHKKINPKIHAKLSWKLQNLQKIKDKKTKQFKFLDLDWFLMAERKNNNSLAVTLNLLNQSIDKQDTFSHLCIFYTKIITTIQSNTHQSDINIHYVNLSHANPIPILSLSKQSQAQIGQRKLQLNIYCSVEQVYTFVMNYIIQNFDELSIVSHQLWEGQIMILIQVYKQTKKYHLALSLTKELINRKQVILSQQQKYKLINQYEMKELSPVQKELLSQIYKKFGISESYPSKQIKRQSSNYLVQQKNVDEYEYEQEQKKFKKPSTDTLITCQKIKSTDKLNLDSNEKQTQLINSRNNSRSRVRKIFQQSPSKKLISNCGVNYNSETSTNKGLKRYQQNNVNAKTNQRLEHIMAITDIKNYMYQPKSSLARFFDS